MHGGREVLLTDSTKRFFDYWNSLPKVDFVPDRSSFSPPAIYDLMPAVTLLEIWSRERIDLRLIGTAVAKGMGIEPTGKNYLDLLAPEAREPYLRLLDAQIAQPCGRRSTLGSRNASGIVARTEVLALPLFHSLSGHHMLVSCFAPMEAVGYEKGAYEIRTFEDTEWVDIGAGVPDLVP
ncbi:MAG: PAS domain-containing protein [Parvibaculum sp.]|uniref:PAS domain-containing protein n=1 Tax=Parvibaculum sp. TaxID=2024848 RepID=UPI0025F017B2|nr:PAS domain-containing protein [Parvibaculum sp.]MCE9651362.1 PAS domain-containing protein [Parvibaculum sp.]